MTLDLHVYVHTYLHINTYKNTYKNIQNKQTNKQTSGISHSIQRFMYANKGYIVLISVCRPPLSLILRRLILASVCEMYMALFPHFKQSSVSLASLSCHRSLISLSGFILSLALSLLDQAKQFLPSSVFILSCAGRRLSCLVSDIT